MTSTQLYWWQQVGLQIAFIMTSKSREVLQILLAGCPATWHQAPLLDCIMVEDRKLVCHPCPAVSQAGLYVKGCLFGLGSRHWHVWRRRGEKQFREKSENGTHNSSVILFAVDGKEKPIRLGSGEYPLPSQCANRQTHTYTRSFNWTTPSVTHNTHRHIL